MKSSWASVMDLLSNRSPPVLEACGDHGERKPRFDGKFGEL